MPTEKNRREQNKQAAILSILIIFLHAKKQNTGNNVHKNKSANLERGGKLFAVFKAVVNLNRHRNDPAERNKTTDKTTYGGSDPVRGTCAEGSKRRNNTAYAR